MGGGGTVGSVSPTQRMRPSLRRNPPGLALEREAWAAGREVVVGVDEVGRGSWAGPLTVAAVAVPRTRRITGVRDSKLLTPAERETLYARVVSWSPAWAVGHVEAHECDALGMSGAQRLAARRALGGLGVDVDVVLVDGNWDFVSAAANGAAVRTVVKGDAVSVGIAAASVVAKVTRDRLMCDDAEEFPGYDFHRNKGYPCPRHRVALAGMGPSSVHRRSWASMQGEWWSSPPPMLPARLAGHDAGDQRQLTLIT